MNSRRKFLFGTGASLAYPHAASALEECPAQGMAPGTCSAMLDLDRFYRQGLPIMQRADQWCWSACIEMICRWYGIVLTQESIVNRIYGGPANLPGGDKVLTAALNAKWIADDGTNFAIRAKIFSPAMGVGDVSNQMVIDDLRNERPLLLGARTHATVVARADYIDTSTGPSIAQVHVIDPFPGAAPSPLHARFLHPDEMVPITNGGSLRYLASISIS